MTRVLQKGCSCRCCKSLPTLVLQKDALTNVLQRYAATSVAKVCRHQCCKRMPPLMCCKGMPQLVLQRYAATSVVKVCCHQCCKSMRPLVLQKYAATKVAKVCRHQWCKVFWRIQNFFYVNTATVESNLLRSPSSYHSHKWR